MDAGREFAEGNVSGARRLSRSWWELRAGHVAPDRAKPVVVPDGDSRGATLAAVTLRELG